LVNDAGSEDARPIEELVVVRDFGESIYPGLKIVGQISEGSSKPCHTIINGENYHALETLLYAMQGQVDVMYLDPPYNSGARDWTYNNDYVDSNDTYRHSKWLSFMEKRLVLGRRLLKDDAVMVVTIDENEVGRLGVLLDQLFPSADITLVTIVINTKGVTRSGVPRFSRVEEYAYFCFFGNAGVLSIGDDLLTDSEGDDEEDEVDDVPSDSAEPSTTGPGWRKLLRSGDDPRRQDREKMFFPIWIDPTTNRITAVGDYLPLGQAPSYEPNKLGHLPVWPIRQNGTEGRWGVGVDTLRELVERGFVRVRRFDPKRKTWGVSYLTKQVVADIDDGKYEVLGMDAVTNVAILEGEGTSAVRRIKTVWFRKRHNAGVGGTALVSDLVGVDRPFNFPKSVFAVRDTLAILTEGKTDAVIVDFFGGSGTTAHATMMLNAEDGGTRRCVLVTNNEVDVEEQGSLRTSGSFPGDEKWESRGIFYRATKPRLEASVRGKRADGSPIPSKWKNQNGTRMSGGYPESVTFLELTYLDRNDVSRGKAFEAIAPLLWMRAGSQGSMIAKVKRPFAAPEGAHYAVLFDINHWSPFVEALRDRAEVTHVFIVTDSIAQYQQVVAELPPTVETSMLYEDYLRNFEINMGGSK
jgi:adenine-specific DNA-methyltransferase